LTPGPETVEYSSYEIPVPFERASSLPPKKRRGREEKEKKEKCVISGQWAISCGAGARQTYLFGCAGISLWQCVPKGVQRRGVEGRRRRRKRSV